MKQQDILEQPVVSLAGVGGHTAKRLEKLGIAKIRDLLFHLPLRYEDRTRVQRIGTLSNGMSALICARVEFLEVLPRGRRGLICRIGDGSGYLDLRFFHFTAKQQQDLQTGVQLSCFGEIRHGYAGLEIVHPEYKVLHDDGVSLTETALTPVYPLTEGLHQNLLRRIIRHALAICAAHPEALNDWLPAETLQDQGVPSFFEALQTLHAPAPQSADSLSETLTPARRRLAFEELLAHHLSLKKIRDEQRLFRAPPLPIHCARKQEFLQALPFVLTGAQRRVIADVENDLQQDKPMLRLIQGDVGSGKTVVAASAALHALAGGFQVAVMAPTELLAEQHWRNFRTWFEPLQVNVALLTGQQKGSRRQQILQELQDGRIAIAVGTHALFQNSVIFNRLGLIVIDEQHRFGVHQRLALREKAHQRGFRPHQLVMTATPIPRTLAMLEYADLDISVIDELPPGRKPVVTRVVPAERRDEVIAHIAAWIVQGRQAYWVCTLIEESEVLQCEAAENAVQTLNAALPGIRIGLVHGRMKAADKEQIMQDFKQRQLDLLVATTVIEVGVDVPNAGLMIIENAERLGLSQLHQLRGRVGRGSEDSYCLLLYQGPLSETAKQRLGMLRESGDGFAIAERDLQLRGPGEVLGTRQTGQISFKIADLSKDCNLLPAIHRTAEILRADIPHAVQPLIERWLSASTQFAEV
ncbi:MAG: ATP-dependent DNA helicase RecG [Gammaproteobacteria bacterium]